MVALDRTEQRIVGVLIEKQRTVPDTYPLSENALVAGCNQSNNRDPLMELPSFAVAGALMALHEKGVVARVEGAGRVRKFRHRLDEVLPASADELAVLAELLLRGPQAPGALKPRVARFGYHAGPEAIEVLLRAMAARRPALVEQLPLGPREQQRRWRHLLGDGSEMSAGAASPEAAEPGAARTPPPPLAPTTGAGASITAAAFAALTARVDALEAELRALRAELGRPSG